jgi:hypothetical protein
MSKYTAVSLYYDGIKILNTINNYKTLGPRPCTLDEIKNINDILNLKYPVQDMLYFAIGPNRVGEIHIDENLLRDEKTALTFALNLPLINAHNVKMSWWQKKDANQMDEYNLGVYTAKFKILKHENADCTDSVYYTLPTIVSVCDYHSVENVSDNPSYFISLRFGKEVTKEMLIDSISDLNS